MTAMEHMSPRSRLAGRIGTVLLIVVSVAPFAGLHNFVHFSAPGGTGFIQYDMPYYVANGREVFERGNGLTYPNPYDTDPNAPPVYFHWLLWLLGFGVTKLHLDPGLLLVAAGVMGALGCAWLTLSIVEVLSADRRYVKLLFLMAMWGAGVVCLGQAAINVLNGREPWLMLLRLDPTYWFTSWGRNAIYPTEAIYHLLVAGSWLAAFRGRWKLSLAWAAVVAATHPFSGLAQLLIQFTWSSIRLIQLRQRDALRYWLGATACLAAFAGYYALYLPSIPQHQAIQRSWSLDWSIGAKSMIAAWGMVGVLAAARLWKDRNRLSVNEFFLIVCWAVSFLLVIHDRFMKPIQPLHFTRGYVWFPLFLLALPLIQLGFAYVRRHAGPVALSCAVTLALGIASADNIALFVITAQKPRDGFYLSTSERAVFEWAEQSKLDGVLLCESTELCYLSATYTAMRPLVGHMYNTPAFEERVRRTAEWFEGRGSGPWFSDIDLILAGRDQPMPLLDRLEWEVAYENQDLVLLRRRP